MYVEIKPLAKKEEKGPEGKGIWGRERKGKNVLKLHAERTPRTPYSVTCAQCKPPYNRTLLKGHGGERM